jgi:adenosine deaminase
VRDLALLPKAHLHVHLEGAMRRSTLAELSEGVAMPTPPVAAASDFADFMALYVAACRVLIGPEEVFRLFRELADDAAESGAVWIEPHVDTGLHAGRLGTDDEVLELLLAAASAAEQATNVGVGLLVSADRTLDPAIGEQQARRAARHAGAGVVAFGLANDEAYPPEPFADAFAIARAAGLISAPHAGELAGPKSVSGALDALRADRLGHGVRAVEDAALVRRLSDEGVCCDVCPSSNLRLRLYPSIEWHPVGSLIDAGVPVTLNADDPLMFGSSLLDEYRLVRDGWSLDDEAMAAVARTSIERSGMPDNRKRAALAGVDAWLSEP